MTGGLASTAASPSSSRSAASPSSSRSSRRAAAAAAPLLPLLHHQQGGGLDMEAFEGGGGGHISGDPFRGAVAASNHGEGSRRRIHQAGGVDGHLPGEPFEEGAAVGYAEGPWRRGRARPPRRQRGRGPHHLGAGRRAPWQQGSFSAGAREVREQRLAVSNLRHMLPPTASHLSSMGPPLCPPLKQAPTYQRPRRRPSHLRDQIQLHPVLKDCQSRVRVPWRLKLRPINTPSIRTSNPC
jgi:hypothetical protein